MMKENWWNSFVEWAGNWIQDKWEEVNNIAPRIWKIIEKITESIVEFIRNQ